MNERLTLEDDIRYEVKRWRRELVQWRSGELGEDPVAVNVADGVTLTYSIEAMVRRFNRFFDEWLESRPGTTEFEDMVSRVLIQRPDLSEPQARDALAALHVVFVCQRVGYASEVFRSLIASNGHLGIKLIFNVSAAVGAHKARGRIARDPVTGLEGNYAEAKTNTAIWRGHLATESESDARRMMKKMLPTLLGRERKSDPAAARKHREELVARFVHKGMSKRKAEIRAKPIVMRAHNLHSQGAWSRAMSLPKK